MAAISLLAACLYIALCSILTATFYARHDSISGNIFKFILLSHHWFDFELIYHFSLVGLFIFVLRDPLSSHPLARPSSRVQLVKLVVRLTLTIAYILLGPYPAAKWILILLFTFGVSAVAVLNTWVFEHDGMNCTIVQSLTFQSKITVLS
jgi:hypothetical protein